MTALLGFDDGETVWLAADRRGCSNGSHEDIYRKISPLGPYQIALSGNAFINELVEELSPQVPPDASPSQALRLLRTHLKEDGWSDSYDKDADFTTFDLNLIMAGPAGMYWSGCSARPQLCSLHRFYGMGSAKEHVEVAATAISRFCPAWPIPRVVLEAFTVAAEYHDGMSPHFDLVCVKRRPA